MEWEKTQWFISGKKREENSSWRQKFFLLKNVGQWAFAILQFWILFPKSFFSAVSINLSFWNIVWGMDRINYLRPWSSMSVMGNSSLLFSFSHLQLVIFRKKLGMSENSRLFVKISSKNFKRIWTIIRLTWATDSTQNKRQFNWF